MVFCGGISRENEGLDNGFSWIIPIIPPNSWRDLINAFGGSLLWTLRQVRMMLQSKEEYDPKTTSILRGKVIRYRFALWIVAGKSICESKSEIGVADWWFVWEYWPKGRFAIRIGKNVGMRYKGINIDLNVRQCRSNMGIAGKWEIGALDLSRTIPGYQFITGCMIKIVVKGRTYTTLWSWRFTKSKGTHCQWSFIDSPWNPLLDPLEKRSLDPL